jgi:hypothetical protein
MRALLFLFTGFCSTLFGSETCREITHSWETYCADPRTDLPIPPQLSQTEIALQFSQAKEGFISRWDAFAHQHGPFVSFNFGKANQALEDEFQQIQKTRFTVWFANPDAVIRESAQGYEIAQSLLYQDGARARNCIAFAYNNTAPFYNASTLCVGSFTCIACEGPRSKDVDKFFQLLVNYKVTHLVRLTPSYDGDVKKCHPYWDSHCQMIDSFSGKLLVPVGANVTYPIQLLVMENWKDHQGTDPNELLQMVLQVKRELEESGGLLAVHCSAGVGRTGTFLAALAIIDAIDNKQPLSIEEIVYRLSLQRFQCVAKSSQYIVLHRLAERYLEQQTLKRTNNAVFKYRRGLALPEF